MREELLSPPPTLEAMALSQMPLRVRGLVGGRVAKSRT